MSTDKFDPQVIVFSRVAEEDEEDVMYFEVPIAKFVLKARVPIPKPEEDDCDVKVKFGLLNTTVDDEPWITTYGRIRKTQKGEAIVFKILLEHFVLICITNIPNDDEESAEVFVKFKMREENLRPAKGNNHFSEGSRRPAH